MRHGRGAPAKSESSEDINSRSHMSLHVNLKYGDYWRLSQELCRSELLKPMEKESDFLPARCLKVSGVVTVTGVCYKDKEVAQAWKIRPEFKYSSRFSDKSTSQLAIESLSSCTVWILAPRTPQIGGHQHEPRSCLETPQIEISNHELYISDDHH
ncbi:predicted protein [Arabidopsis lyrata subsp. lyrata]|uniref:Predicted protein n=1 Tax=Arabidopsis lyrata subsp. lyrata TaxID=81972 RepID=D7LYT6_ARALL|nr:predicted protein [Arabidopsis lyrata subsp. lyrata]